MALLLAASMARVIDSAGLSGKYTVSMANACVPAAKELVLSMTSATDAIWLTATAPDLAAPLYPAAPRSTSTPPAFTTTGPPSGSVPTDRPFTTTSAPSGAPCTSMRATCRFTVASASWSTPLFFFTHSSSKAESASDRWPLAPTQSPIACSHSPSLPAARGVGAMLVRALELLPRRLVVPDATKLDASVDGRVGLGAVAAPFGGARLADRPSPRRRPKSTRSSA
jgi:hypothetical protein